MRCGGDLIYFNCQGKGDGDADFVNCWASFCELPSTFFMGSKRDFHDSRIRHTRTCMYTHTRTHTHTHVHAHTSTHIHTYTHMHTHTHTPMHACTHTHTHTHASSPVFAHLRSSSDKYQVLRGHQKDDTLSTDTSYIQALTYFEQRQKVAETFSLRNEMFVSPSLYSRPGK